MQNRIVFSYLEVVHNNDKNKYTSKALFAKFLPKINRYMQALLQRLPDPGILKWEPILTSEHVFGFLLYIIIYILGFQPTSFIFALYFVLWRIFVINKWYNIGLVRRKIWHSVYVIVYDLHLIENPLWPQRGFLIKCSLSKYLSK